ELGDLVLGIDQVDEGAVIDRVFAVAEWLLAIENAEFLGRYRDLGPAPSEPQHARIELPHIIGDDRWGVARRIDGDEDRLRLLRQRPQLTERLGHRIERGRTSVRT